MINMNSKWYRENIANKEVEIIKFKCLDGDYEAKNEAYMNHKKEEYDVLSDIIEMEGGECDIMEEFFNEKVVA